MLTQSKEQFSRLIQPLYARRYRAVYDVEWIGVRAARPAHRAVKPLGLTILMIGGLLWTIWADGRAARGYIVPPLDN